MHYGAWFFSKNKKPTIRVKRTDLACGSENSLGQKNGLSNGDINAVAHLYAPFDPTVILNADGRFELFMESYDNRLIYRKKQGAPSVNNGWDSPWSKIGLQEPIPSNVRPAVSRTTDGALEIFWDYGDNIYTRTQARHDSPFSNGNYYNRNIKHYGSPIIGRDADGRLEVFFVAGDDSRQLYHARQSSLSSPSLDFLNPLGGNWSPNRRPVVAKNADGRLEVFMIGLDGALLHKWQTSSTDSTKWSNDWEPLEIGSLGTGPFLSDPVVSLNARNGLELFVISKEGSLHNTWQDTVAPDRSTWDLHGNTLIASAGWLSNVRPAVAQNTDGRIELFIVDNGGILWHRWQTSKGDSSQWSNWDQQIFGGRKFPTNARPVVAKNADGRLEVFIVGSDDRIYHNWQILSGGNLQWNSASGIQLQVLEA
jgi:hypothetical protein